MNEFNGQSPLPKTSSVISELQNEQSRQLLDLVDELRSFHVNKIINLPQIAVCGDQSSGKSSLLEAITRVPFPRNDTLCTRYATEIVLRRGIKDLIRAKIIPSSNAPEGEIARLENFAMSSENFEELSTMIAAATKTMGLPELRDDEENPETAPTELKAFSRHVLRIEITGPERPMLTLVDLPGYVHSPTNKHSKADVDYIGELMTKYIREKRTIILAVISATTEYANQIVLKKVREADKDGMRTLGVITKLDMVKDEPGRQREILALAMNKDRKNKFDLGWHVVRNRSFREQDVSFEERNVQEKDFFDLPEFDVLTPGRKGIKNLSKRLADIVFQHLQEELPHVSNDVQQKLTEMETRLRQLGEKLGSIQGQREHLLCVSQEFEKIVSNALLGHYNHDYFRSVDFSVKQEENEPSDDRLCTKVRHYEGKFAMQMRSNGHKYHFPQMEDAVGAVTIVRDSNIPRDPGHIWTDQQAIRWVKRQLAAMRGRELPGQYNPMLISQLFWEQSMNWQAHGTAYIESIDDLISRFLESVLHFVTAGYGNERLQSYIDKKLDERLKNARKELNKVIKVHKLTVKTSDPHFTRKIANLRRLRQIRQTIDLTGEDSSAANDAMDALLAVYGEAVEFFITAVLGQVIEQCMLEGLAEETFCPTRVSQMQEEDISFIMAEPGDVAEERESLKTEIEKLKQAKTKLQGIAPTQKRRLGSGVDIDSRISKRAARRGHTT